LRANKGTLPELDDQHRPKFAFDRVIHDHCPRRAHFDAGRFAVQYGDEGHRHGWCLYKLGCKGPDTHAGCSTRHFNEIPDVWPIGIGATCIGCTEKSIAFRIPLFETVPIHEATPPDTYPPVSTSIGSVSATGVGVVGIIGGALGGAAWVAGRRFCSEKEQAAINEANLKNTQDDNPKPEAR
jgi:hydrogenase small subunit